MGILTSSWLCFSMLEFTPVDERVAFLWLCVAGGKVRVGGYWLNKT